MYCMRRPDGRLVIGGARSHAPAAAGSRGGAVVSGAGDDDSVGSDAAADRLKEFLSQLLANFGETLVVEKEWTGVMGFSQDGKPLVGPVPEGLLHGGLAPGSVFVGAGFVRAISCPLPLSPPRPDPDERAQNGHGMPACSGAGKALAAMVAGAPEEEVHEVVRTQYSPARFAAQAQEAAVAATDTARL